MVKGTFAISSRVSLFPCCHQVKIKVGIKVPHLQDWEQIWPEVDQVAHLLMFMQTPLKTPAIVTKTLLHRGDSTTATSF